MDQYCTLTHIFYCTIFPFLAYWLKSMPGQMAFPFFSLWPFFYEHQRALFRYTVLPGTISRSHSRYTNIKKKISNRKHLHMSDFSMSNLYSIYYARPQKCKYCLWNRFYSKVLPSLGTNIKIPNFKHSEHWISEHQTYIKLS